MNSDEAVADSTPVLEIDGPCATVRLNRPRHLNRLHPEDVAALAAIFERLTGDTALRVVVLTGTGRAFSAGFHIGAIDQPDAAVDRDSGPISFETMVDALERLELPTICRLNGSVYGGATDLALACDFRIGVEGSEMVMPAARLGLHYYRGGIKRYVSRLGIDIAKRLFLAAEAVPAAEMLRIGYLTELVAPDALDEAVARLVGVIAARAPLAVQGMKIALNEFARGELDIAALDRRLAVCRDSADLREGVAAWRERRPPVFRGG